MLNAAPVKFSMIPVKVSIIAFLLFVPLELFSKEKTVQAVMEKISGPVFARQPQFHHLLKLKDLKLSLLVFKKEGQVELWQRQPRLEKLATYQMVSTSGGLGPKNKQGDRQIPEGVYKLTLLNPASRYHLSIRVNYPNENDLKRAKINQIKDPGGDIYFHGRAESRGCIALDDRAIEELFYLTEKIGLSQFQVLIAPQRGEFSNWPFPKPQSPDLIHEKYQELQQALKPFMAHEASIKN